MARRQLVERLRRAPHLLRHAQFSLQHIDSQLQHHVARRCEQLTRTNVSHRQQRRNTNTHYQVFRKAWLVNVCERLWPLSDGGTFLFANHQ